jgi:hypothetical protein
MSRARAAGPGGCQTPASAAEAARLAGEGGFTWIDLEETREAGLRQISEVLDVGSKTFEALRQADRRPSPPPPNSRRSSSSKSSGDVAFHYFPGWHPLAQAMAAEPTSLRLTSGLTVRSPVFLLAAEPCEWAPSPGSAKPSTCDARREAR